MPDRNRKPPICLAKCAGICERLQPIEERAEPEVERQQSQPPEWQAPCPATGTRPQGPALAVSSRLPEASGDGRIGDPVEQGVDRQDAIDTNPDFIDYLNGDIDDDRFIAVHGSAADVEKIIASHGFDHADYILSGLPFSTLPPGVGDAIGAATGRAIRDGGAFLVYQFSPKVKDFIAPHFERIERGFEWVNVPPATLFWAWRDRDRA